MIATRPRPNEEDTDRKRAEEALRASEERFSKAFHISPVGLCLTRLSNGDFLDANPAFCRIFGYAREELIGRISLELGMWVEPHRRKEYLDELRVKSSIQNRESHFRRKSGETGVALHTLVLVEVGGEECILTLFQDITESRRAEAALRESQRFLEKAQEVAHIGSWISGLGDPQALTWSNEVFRIFGMTQETFDGRVETFFALVHPADVENVRRAVAAALKQGAPYDIEHRIVRPDGTIRWVHEQADVIRDPEGKPVQLIGVVQDITSQKYLEEQLRQSQKLEAIGRLAGGVAHDFNNILTVIQGHASLLLGKGDLPRLSEESLREIALAAERAANLTRQLLAFGRRQTIQAKNLDLNEIVDSMSRMLRRILGEDITLEVLSSSNLPHVRADAGMLGQVLLNLAVNSRDAMPRGGRLTIQTSTVTADERYVRRNPEAAKGQFVCLRVADTGCGIAPQNLPHIFEPFFTTKVVGKGTGLGLATVYGIVKQHGGWIEVQSQIDRGTTFLVFLPRGAAEPHRREPVAEEPKVRGGSERILVVEDEQALRELVRHVLEHYGYKVWVAATGVEALAFWSQHGQEIDLVLTDLVMPEGITGRDLAVRLRREKPDLKIIFTTGYSPDVVGEGFALEAKTHFLQKPFQPSVLAKMVRESLDGM
ncbi:MAG: PAS domain S-box protein [Verrucomicrobia bacterium]|nr:PAS domain S-box protein [Verrucomicrobiota bacterium]